MTGNDADYKRLFIDGDENFEPMKIAWLDIENDMDILIMGTQHAGINGPKSAFEMNFVLDHIMNNNRMVVIGSEMDITHRYLRKSLDKDYEASATRAIKIGRNETCSCGSGKKHKFCCLKRK